MIALTLMTSLTLFAQTDTSKRVLKPSSTARTGDHLVFQIGHTTWQNKPDSIKTKGFSRSFNGYFMFDFPFKTNPKWSVGIGPGIAVDNVMFDKMSVGITENTQSVRFNDLSDTNSFKKYKLMTTYLEAPVELRFTARPYDNQRSIKFAIGAKVGTLLSATTKGKNLENEAGDPINSYTEKLKSKRFFNQNRLSLTGRVGFGYFSLFTTYAVTPLFKEGLGPQVRPMTIGLMISGL